VTDENSQESITTFQAIADVLDYLRTDWKVTKTSLYRHKNEGKILPQESGAYLKRDVERYAKTWLKKKSTGKKVSEKMDELQREKLERELKLLDLEGRRKELALGKDLEKYIPREQMEIELAARAGVLEAGLKHWVQSRAAEWVRLVEGDSKKVGDLINMMNQDLNEHINSYALSAEHQIIIDAEEEAGLDDGDETEEEIAC